MSRDVYEYAAIRVVPRVERGELINAGVLLYRQPRAYLCARVELDPTGCTPSTPPPTSTVYDRRSAPTSWPAARSRGRWPGSRSAADSAG